MRTIAKIAALAAIMAVVIPGAAQAKDRNSDGYDSGRHLGQTREMANRSLYKPANKDRGRNPDKDGKHDANLKMFRTGTISAIGTNSFTLTTKEGAVFTVNTAGAEFFSAERTAIALSDLHVNDQIWVRGQLSGAVISASVIYVINPNIVPTVKAGTVTSVNGSVVTLQTKNSGTVTVNTDANTKVLDDGNTANMSDVQVGSKVKVLGLWNKLVDSFNAIVIKLK